MLPPTASLSKISLSSLNLPPPNNLRDGTALPRGSRGVKPASGRKLHDAAFQVGERHFLVWSRFLPVNRAYGD